jgi:asparagine synthase (glutamine-hydrolysing)
MCGIAGIFHPQLPKPVDPARVAAMTDVLAHRGPDGSGIWIAPGIGLGHRRLSIIDLSDAAAQPMLTADGAVALSYNG